MNLKWIFLLVATLTVLFFTWGCGGGGGDTTPSINYPAGTLNQDLSGKLIFEYHNSAWLMDVSSGEYSKIPNTDWENHDGYYGTTNDFWFDMGPNNNNEFTVSTQDDCDIENTTYATCITIQDVSGNYLVHFRILGNTRSPAKLSVDNQYIAIVNEDIFSHEEELQIYDRSGQLLSNRIVTANDFEWLDNNRIIYAEDSKFVITHERSTDPDHQLSLPSGLDGIISSIEVNPSSDKFAFTLTTSGTLVSTHATPWIVNADGTGLRQLAVSTSDTPPPSITSPIWSPDGERILLKEGAFTGNSNLNPGSNGYAYIVPSQDMGKTFILSINEAERSPEVFFLNRYETIKSNPSGTVVNKHFGDIPSWIP